MEHGLSKPSVRTGPEHGGNKVVYARKRPLPCECRRHKRAIFSKSENNIHTDVEGISARETIVENATAPVMAEEISSVVIEPLKQEVLREREDGLFFYRKWWYYRESGIMVNGDMLTGVPVYSYENTLRVVNKNYSYFIPMDKIDYIRTPDGYDCRDEFCP